MGRGNVCVTGKYECLFYIENDDFEVWRQRDEASDDFYTCLLGELDYSEISSGTWYYDEYGTRNEYDDVIECFKSSFKSLFPSFHDCNTWLNNERHAIMENGLFYVCTEDNQWSVAVELVQKENPWGYTYAGLQAKHFPRLRDGLLRCLLERLGRVATRSGAWTSGEIKLSDFNGGEIHAF